MTVSKQTRICPKSLRSLGQAASVAILWGMALAWTARADVTSGVYQTLPGSTVREWGDRVPAGSRIVPFFATLTLDLSAGQPSLNAAITNAVLEGGDPFPLIARSSSGSQLVDGTYRFSGDYLRDLYPSGTQYLFDWKLSNSTNGEVVWNGTTAWAGGHAWYVTISNVTLIPAPWLDIAPVGAGSIQITWATNFADHVLEYSTRLPALSWTTVTNVPAYSADRLSVTLDASTSTRFYRLHKP